MAKIRCATINVHLNVGFDVSKTFNGTEDQIYAEAMDWMHEVALNYISDNDIEDEWDQDLIIAGASHEIIWEDEEPIYMYAVVQEDCQDPVIGIYPSYEEAKEAMHAHCEDWANEVIATQDPMDVFGVSQWDIETDHKWLVEDAEETLHIQKVPVFGVEVKE